MIYTPKADWGVYVPSDGRRQRPGGHQETFQAGDTVVLPEALPISQVWDGANWLVTLYSVLDNSPIYGMIGAKHHSGPGSMDNIGNTPVKRTTRPMASSLHGSVRTPRKLHWLPPLAHRVFL